MDDFRQEHANELAIVKTTLQALEDEYDIAFTESELMHIYQMFMENH